MAKYPSNLGVLIALVIIFCWFTSLFFLLRWDFSFTNPWAYLMALVQMHLYTGLFITAHDSMHGIISPNRKINTTLGWICTLLYAVFPYNRLYGKHHQHHRHVHTDDDPDYHQGSFLKWYFSFIFEYISWWQILTMAVIFNVLKIWIQEANLVLFWVIPALLSTLQLFYFGTWLPHHGEHQNRHQSRTQQKNHLFAFLSCYFFGYHYEHHDSPSTPWWQLWKLKN